MVRENKCCITNCPGLHKSRFSVPLRLFNTWQKALGTSTKLTKRSRICGAHFLKDDIHDVWTSGEGLNQYTIYLKKPRLKTGAVPKLLLNGNIKNSEIPIVKNETTVSSFDDKLNSEITEINQNYNENLECIVSSDTKKSFQTNNTSTSSTIANKKYELFNFLLENKFYIRLPFSWSHDFTTSQVNPKTKFITFFKMGCYGNRCQCIVEKQLVITEKSELIVYVLDTKLTIEEIQIFYPTVSLTNPSVLEVEQIIYNLDKVYVCHGAVLASEFPNMRASFGHQHTMSNGYWKHINCKKILIHNSDMCSWCRRLCYSLKRKNKKLVVKNKIKIPFSPTEKKLLNQLRHTKNIMREKITRISTRIGGLKNRVKKLQEQMKIMRKMVLNKSLSDIVEKPGKIHDSDAVVQYNSSHPSTSLFYN